MIGVSSMQAMHANHANHARATWYSSKGIMTDSKTVRTQEC